MIQQRPVDMESSLNEAAAAASEDGNSHQPSSVSSVTLERPRSRYSRLYSGSSDASERDRDRDKTPSAAGERYRSGGSRLVTSGSGSALSNSSSCGDVPSASYTLRSNRLHKTKTHDDADAAAPPLKNGASLSNHDHASSNGTTTNGNGYLDASPRAQLKDLKLSSSSSSVSSLNASAAAVMVNGNCNDNGSASGSVSTTAASSNHLSNGETNGNAEHDVMVNGRSGSSNGDVSTSATFKLATDSPSTSSKIRNSTTIRNVLPPASPTAARYWDRDASRTTSSALTSASSYNSSSDDVKPTSEEKAEGLCGLKNIGNTCFMNSIIQCLSHTSELTKFLRTQNAARSSASSKDQQILYEFAKLIREMWTSNVRSVTPMELKRAFSSKHRMYSDYNQQDAQEFLRFFLDSLHLALNSGVKGELLKIDDNLSDNKKADLTWEWYSRHENSLIRDLFVGQLKSTLKCTVCHNTSVTFDPFWDLSVPLPSSSRCKLDSCLELFIREEILDGDEMPTCSRCKTRRKSTKSFCIQRFPKYLVIHLKRFSEARWSKLSNIVEFPTGDRELNMGPYGSNHSNIYYSLYAISNHMGSTAGGHYVALCKHPTSKKWHEFNDNIVSDNISESHLVSSSAYILFYERA